MFSNAANNSGSIPFQQADLARILASAEGRQLLALLRRDGGGALQQAAQAVKSGDYEAAKSALEPMLQNPEAAALLSRLKKKSE